MPWLSAAAVAVLLLLRPAPAAAQATTWSCSSDVNFIEGMRYSQTVIDSLSSSSVMAYDAAIARCKELCTGSCKGFFYQQHPNTHQICGFYEDPLSGGNHVWHGHTEGAVCEIQLAGFMVGDLVIVGAVSHNETACVIVVNGDGSFQVDYQDGHTDDERVHGSDATAAVSHTVRDCRLAFAPPAPAPPPPGDEPETRCFEHCLARGFCCNDHSVGSNQLISCAQACMIRARGTSRAECDGHCAEHAAARGCSRTVNGHRYSMCSGCADLGSHCVHGVQQGSDACETGCAQVS